MKSTDFLRYILSLAAACALPISAQAASAAGCKAFKSGAYVGLQPMDELGADRVITGISIDAVKLIVKTPSGKFRLKATADKCAYTTPEGDLLVVAPSGLLLVDQQTMGTFAMLLPAQTTALKSLAGNWNFLNQVQEDDAVRHTYNGIVKVSPAGKVTLGGCDPLGGTCEPPQYLDTLRVNPDGGFDLVNSDGSRLRLFAMKAKGGSLMIVGTNLDRQAFLVGSPAVAKNLPALGEKWGIWDMTVPGRGGTLPLTVSSFKITAVDPDAQTYTRKRTEDCRVDSLAINSGRQGMIYRPAGNFTRCDGSGGSFGDALLLSLRESFGIVVGGWETDAIHYLNVQVVRP